MSRVRNSTTEHTVVIAAGITHYGTSAAEFLTNPAYFAEAVKKAPSGCSGVYQSFEEGTHRSEGWPVREIDEALLGQLWGILSNLK